MKKTLLTLMMLMCINLWITSQDIYPKAIVQNNDTLILITKKQLLQTNIIFSEHSVYKTKLPLLYELISVKDSLLSNKDNQINNYKNIVKVEEEKFNNEKKYSDDLYKKLNKVNKIKKLTIYAIPIAFTIGILCQ